MNDGDGCNRMLFLSMGYRESTRMYKPCCRSTHIDNSDRVNPKHAV